jgi:protein-disulfide isomerase
MMRRPTNMPRFFSISRLLPAVAIAVFGVFAACAQSPMQVLDPSALHPPVGSRVAIVEFDDLQCPSCAAANPILKAAAAKYHIPWVRHDFLIPYHNWSRIAAINARWFDQKSKPLGDEYRDEVFASQASIYNPDSLAQFTQKFAQNTGIRSTPTIFVVTAGGKGAPFTQVMNPAQQLYTTIDQAIANTAIAPKSTVAKRSN